MTVWVILKNEKLDKEDKLNDKEGKECKKL